MYLAWLLYLVSSMYSIADNKINYDEIVACLKSGGIIIYPTDTAYALGCDATNEAAVEKIFKIKGRAVGKTLPLIMADASMAKDWARFSAVAEKLARQYWPGPLTLVLPVKKVGLAAAVMAGDFIALRVPARAVARTVSRHLGQPLVCTSANAAGAGPFYNVKDVKKSLSAPLALIDHIIDVGELPPQRVSTMVKVWDNTCELLRRGAIDFKMIENA